MLKYPDTHRIILLDQDTYLKSLTSDGKVQGTEKRFRAKPIPEHEARQIVDQLRAGGYPDAEVAKIVEGDEPL